MAAATAPIIPASKRPLTVISESVAIDNNTNLSNGNNGTNGPSITMNRANVSYL